MSIWKELLVIGLASCFISVIVLYEPRPRQLVRWFLKGLLFFGIVAFVIHQLDKLWQKLKSSDLLRRAKETPVEEVKSRQQEKLSEKQSQYSQQAEDYTEKVVKPREEAKTKQRQEDFYKFAGPAWKGEGQKLGVAEGSSDSAPSGVRKRGTGKDAAAVRRLPDHVTSTDHVTNPADVQEEEVKPKVKISLPDEPSPGTGVVTLSFRTAHRLHRRRFCVTDTVQVLLDFITSLGYHQRSHALCSTYPRQCLSDQPDHTLQQMGINTGCTLNVEEKD